MDFTDEFVNRHVGPRPDDIDRMLETIGYDTIDEFIADVIPSGIRMNQPLAIGEGCTEREALQNLEEISSRNQVYRSFIGMGYYNCITPPVIQRNILENPGWYTAYTPYQAEIAQGRLEALMNFQTMIVDLTGLPIANASLLDEASAAAEAMAMALAIADNRCDSLFFVSDTCHPQTIAVLRTRAEPLGIELCVGDFREFKFGRSIVGALVQYPATDGVLHDYRNFGKKVHDAEGLLVVATDLMALTLLIPPGEFDADIVVGSAQRFGVPIGYGGPHAAFLSTKEEFKRKMPGRVAGMSRDGNDRPAIRLALQTREQHIRREKATSNICTAQVLLAVMAGMYAVYHGPKGLRRIASRVHQLTSVLRIGLKELGYGIDDTPFFDTIAVNLGSIDLDDLLSAVNSKRFEMRSWYSDERRRTTNAESG